MATQSSSAEIGALLQQSKTIAVVGLSDSPLRPSYGVSAYMQHHGYRIIPVNPNIRGALGEKAVASLSDIKEKIDLVDIFRRSELVEDVVDEAIKLGVPAIWMQEGYIHVEHDSRRRWRGTRPGIDRSSLGRRLHRFGAAAAITVSMAERSPV